MSDITIRAHRLYMLSRWIIINNVEIEGYKKEIAVIKEEIATEKAFCQWKDLEHLLEREENSDVKENE